MPDLRPRETTTELESWKTNDLLPETVQERIRQLLSDAIEDMVNLDLKIVDTKPSQRNFQQHLEGLQHQKIEDTARMHALRRAISSLKKFPPELLVEIFLHTPSQFGDSSDMWIPPTKMSSYPWILTHVCTHWRNVVWASPVIWGRIMIGDYHLSNRGGDRGGDIRKWSNRVNTVLHHILIMTRSLLSVHCLSEPGTDAIVDQIISHNHRFRSLELQLGKESFHAFMDLPQHSLQHLEWIDIRILSDLPPDSTTSCLETLPNLREVSLDSATDINPTLSLLLPWEKLTDITVTCMDIPPTVIHTALQRCPALQKCQVTIGAGTIPPSNTLITLPNLEKLMLIFRHTLAWDAFFRPFVAPALNSFCHNAPEAPLRIITSLILRSKCSLSNIAFTECTEEPSESDYEFLLEQLPNVTSLETVWITPPSILKKIPNTLLPLLPSWYVHVHPDGLEAMLDILDTYISRDVKDSERREIDMIITCHHGPGFDQVKRCYRLCHRRYSGYNWLKVVAYSTETGCSLEVVDDDSEEESDGSEEEGDDSNSGHGSGSDSEVGVDGVHNETEDEMDSDDE